jgi:hypothetical protein
MLNSACVFSLALVPTGVKTWKNPSSSIIQHAARTIIAIY